MWKARRKSSHIARELFRTSNETSGFGRRTEARATGERTQSEIGLRASLWAPSFGQPLSLACAGIVERCRTRAMLLDSCEICLNASGVQPKSIFVTPRRRSILAIGAESRKNSVGRRRRLRSRGATHKGHCSSPEPHLAFRGFVVVVGGASPLDGHNRTDPSSSPVRTARPSGLKATAWTAATRSRDMPRKTKEFRKLAGVAP
jgi:hypothetical protein